MARQNLDGAIDDIHARQQSPARGRNSVVDILIRPMSILHSVAGVRHWIRIRIPFLVRTHYVYELLKLLLLGSASVLTLWINCFILFLHFELSVKSPCLLGPSLEHVIPTSCPVPILV